MNIPTNKPKGLSSLSKTKSHKTIVITGGNSGLGYECAKVIASADKGWHVVLAARNQQQLNQAAEELTRLTGNTNITPLILDLGSRSSVYRFVDQLGQANLPPLTALICNAGAQYVQETARTIDGIESTFGVNHLGHYLLVRLLLEKLSEPGRIVVVSSDTHDPAKKTGMPNPHYLHPEIMASPEQSDAAMAALSLSRRGQTRYTTSKLCNLYFAYELSQRLSQLNRTITVNAFNPGMMPGSGLARDYGSLSRFMWNNVLPLLRFIRPSVRTTERSGADLAKLILDDSLTDVNGKYWDGRQIIASSPESYEKERAAELWNWSSQALQLSSSL